MYNKDERDLIHQVLEANLIRTASLVYKATCNNTKANIQKVKIM